MRAAAAEFCAVLPPPLCLQLPGLAATTVMPSRVGVTAADELCDFSDECSTCYDESSRLESEAAAAGRPSMLPEMETLPNSKRG